MKTPDFYLEQYRLGEADDGIVGRIAEDPSAAARLDDLESDSAEILARYTPEKMAAAIEDRLKSASATEATQRVDARERSGVDWSNVIDRLRSLFSSPLIAMGAVAALILAVTPLFINESVAIEEAGDTTAGIERIKGLDPALRIYRQSGPSEAVELADEATAYAGDRLQIAYRAAGFRYGVIFSIDGNGYLTLHYPTEPGQEADLGQEGEVALPFAYVLDDAPRFESFYMVLSDRSIDAWVLVAALQEEIGSGSVDRVANRVEQTIADHLSLETVFLERIDLRKFDGE